MNRLILTIAFTITALVISSGEASAFFRKKRACAPQAQTVSYPAPVSCCGNGTWNYGSASYGQQYYGNSSYGQPYYNNMGYGSSNSNGVLGTVSNFGENVIDTTGRVLTMPYRAIR